MHRRLIVTENSGQHNLPIFKGQAVYSEISVNNCRPTLRKVPEEQGILFTPWRMPEINFGSSLLPQIIFNFLETRHAVNIFIYFFFHKSNWSVH